MRPDIVLTNIEKKKCILVELTVPFEENIANAQLRKATKYRGLVADVEQAGWSCAYHSVEIGSRGIAAHGTSRTLQSLTSAPKKAIKAAVKLLIQTAVKCSYVIFKERKNSDISLNVIVSRDWEF